MREHRPGMLITDERDKEKVLNFIQNLFFCESSFDIFLIK